MQFAVLGPMEVRDGAGRVVAVGGAKPRALLAALLLEPGRAVSTDRLLDALWGESPPPTAAKALQVHVRALRRALGDGAIVTRPPGYALAAGEEAVDAARFERLAAAGRSALAAADAAAAERVLAEALGLWRGAAFADLAYEPFLQDEAGRLEELRDAAVEDLLDARLALGRHGELVAELESRVARHPLRERLRAQLMLALYRSGRQAEALEAFRTGRAAMRDELGLEPGPALRELHQRILEQAVDLAPPAPAGAADAPDERRLVTLLAVACEPVDGRGDPEEVDELLEAAAAFTAEAVASAGGRMEAAATGDVLLATFAADRALEGHVRQALEAAHAARAAIAGRCDGQMAVRAAIETGEVVVRDGGRRVSGGPVPVALRLVAAAAPGVVETGPRAAALLEPRPAARAFVGRDAELAILGSVLERAARDGGAHRVAVVGDAGVGKTSLARRFGEGLPEGVAFRVAPCTQLGAAAPYRPLAGFVREWLGAGTARGRVGLEILLGLQPGEDLHPLQARDRVRREWVALLDELCDECPLVLVVEDLHWAGEPLLDLLDVTLAEAAGPLLLLTTTRPEGAARPPASSRVTQVWLDPLAPAEAERLLDAVAEDLPEPLARAALERAEGNPFFLEEVVAALREAGDALAPDSVHSVIAGRIALLPPRERQALQAAAVIGHTFSEPAVRALLRDESAGLALLERRDFIRRVRGAVVPGERHFSFKHVLTRDVAYESIPLATRAKRHADFAAWLEREGAGRDEHAPLLAHHYAAAAERLEPLRPDAVRWLHRAAELAVGAYDIDAALELLHRALPLEESAAGRVQLWLAAGRACRIRFDTHGFRTAVEQALELGPDRETEAHIHAELAFAGSQPWVWTEPPPDDVVRHWTDRALELSEPGTSTYGVALVAKANLAPDVGLPVVAEARAIGVRTRDPLLQTRVAQSESEVLIAHGRLHEACEVSLRHLEDTASHLDPFQLEGRLFQSGFAFLRAARFAEARPIVERHHDVAMRLSPHHAVHAVAMDLLLEVMQERWDVAAAMAADALCAAHANTATPCQFNWRGLMYAALAAAAAGRPEQARELEAAAREEPEVGGTPATEGTYLRLCLRRGDLGELERLLAARPEINRWGDAGYDAARMDGLAAIGARPAIEAEAPRLIEMDGYDAPFALRALGQVREDEHLLARAAAAFARMGLPLPGHAPALYRPA